MAARNSRLRTPKYRVKEASMRNLRLELGVVLVVCAFSAAAAYAQQAVERPFKMTGHSQVVITFSPDCNPYVATFPYGCRY